MGTVQPIHSLWVIIIATLLYAGWMIWYFARENRRMKKKEEERPPEKKCKGDVIGRSLFVLPRRHSQPQAAIAEENEEAIEKDNIFATSEVPGHPRQIAPDELDDVFGETPEGETNDPIDPDLPETSDFPEDDTEEEEEEEDYQYDDQEEYLPAGSRCQASGASFEEMGEAYRHVAHNPQLTDAQKEDTGRILLEMQHTDLFEAMVSGHPGREDKVTTFIDAYLTAFHQRTAGRNEESLPLQGAAPADFNIMDYR